MPYHLPRMRRHAGALAILLAMLAVLAACGPSGVTSTPSPTPTTAPTPTATPTPTVLYQADWSHGLAGWQATTGWKVVDGVLVSDAGAQRAFTIPFRPAGPNYTIELRLQVVSVPQNGRGKFQLHALPAPGQDGYLVEAYHLLTTVSKTFADHPQFGVMIDPLSSDALLSPSPYIDYEHGFTAHTYRIEVRGSFVSFYSDYFRIKTARSKSTPTLSTGPFQFMCSGVVVRLSALRILSA